MPPAGRFIGRLFGQRTSLGSDIVAGIILAAGEAQRMGKLKLLLPFRGAPLLQAAIDTAEASRLDKVVIVTGAFAEAIESKIRTTSSTLARNPDFRRGNMSSLESGVAEVADADAVVILAGDQPDVAVDVIDGLIDLWQAKRPWAVVTEYDDRIAYPFLLSGDALHRAIAMGGPKLLWRLLAEDRSGRVAMMQVAGSAPHDINTPEDFNRLTGQSP